MKNVFRTLVIASLLCIFVLPTLAERVSIYDESAKNSMSLVKILQQQKVKLNKLLKMRRKVDSWEKHLKKVDSGIHKSALAKKQDLKSVSNGLMQKVDFDKKWIGSKNRNKSSTAQIKFQEEIKKYNKYRLGYNLLAQELAKHLQHRKPTEVRVLVKQIDLLVASLQQAISSEDFAEAKKIANSSQLATEFGYLDIKK